MRRSERGEKRADEGDRVPQEIKNGCEGGYVYLFRVFQGG